MVGCGRVNLYVSFNGVDVLKNIYIAHHNRPVRKVVSRISVSGMVDSPFVK